MTNVGAHLAVVTEMNDVPECRDILPAEKVAIPLLNPVERLGPMTANEALLAAHRELEAVGAPACSVMAFQSTIAI